MENRIEAIPRTMEKFLGCKGKMLIPSPDAVEAVVAKIRKGKLATILQIREKLARDFKVATACPAATMKALGIISTRKNPKPYWRVIKPNGELISRFPGGIHAHGEYLENEGFELDCSNRNPVVANYKTRLTEFS